VCDHEIRRDANAPLTPVVPRQGTVTGVRKIASARLLDFSLPPDLSSRCSTRPSEAPVKVIVGALTIHHTRSMSPTADERPSGELHAHPTPIWAVVQRQKAAPTGARWR
jgi:hypothetical protein